MFTRKIFWDSQEESSEENFQKLIQLENPVDMMIHELKQPLLCILILAEKIEKHVHKLEPSLPQLKSLHRDIRSVLVSIEQMKDIMSARSVTSQFLYIEEGWGQTISQYLSGIEEISKTKNIQLNIENHIFSQEEGPDTRAMIQLLSNLIYNAFDELTLFTPQDPQIAVLLEIQEDDLLIEVHDNGRGVPEKLRKNIFERGITTKGQHGGSGYGLWVCKKVSEVAGGSIFIIDSSLLGGACFQVHIPLRRQLSMNKVA